jgi:hypothetical protein
VPEHPHGMARHFSELGACTIREISEVSRGWRHCASVLASAPQIADHIEVIGRDISLPVDHLRQSPEVVIVVRT